METMRATKYKKKKNNCDRNNYHQAVDNEEYERLAGTAGIKGQLYETKLISLINFRLIHNDSVDQFSLASNRNDVGKFDDICFKATIKRLEKEEMKEVNVFIQAKHRENNKRLKFTSETDLAKYFNSYLEIRRAFEPSSKDRFFRGKFDETQCFFVIYTTAKDDPNNKIYEGNFADYLKELIGTGGSCTQPSYTDESLEFLCKIVMKEQIKQLAKFICDKCDSVNWMSNDLLLRYHVILAQNVLKISEIEPEGHRIATFRPDFFTTNEEFIVLFKNTLCLEVLKKRKSEETDVQSLLLKFLSEPSEVTILSKLLGSVLTYKNSKLEFVGKSMTNDLKRQLDKANVSISQSTVYEAAELAAKEYLLSLKLKVPASFGNKDLTIRGTHEKIDKRLNHLTLKLIEILKQSNPNNIVTIDDSLEEGFLQLNGGIASAIGNILVFDESSKLLKFTNNPESLGKLGKRWHESLKSKIENLHEYKFNLKVKKFPKLSFERVEYDVSLVRDFYDKLLFYTNQADQNGVEEILRGEIDDHPCSDENNFRVRSDLIFLKYHDEIQKLWMKPKVGYLTKKSKIYENAVTNAMSESLMGVLNIMHKTKYKYYTFNENALKPFELHGPIIGAVIATGSCELTLAKVEQYLGNKDHIVLDLEFIYKLPLKNHNTLCKELTNTHKENILIFVCDNFQDSKQSGKRLENIVKAVNGKRIIIITNKTSVDIMTEYFSQTSNVLNDERIFVFTDLSVESQRKFLATSKIKVQGEDISLDIIGDDESVRLIDEDIFSKLINNETIEINDTSIYNYEAEFYIDRRVSRTKKQEHDKFDDVKDKVLETFYDLEDDVVIITGESGMGMTVLLSHLSLKTKQLNSKVWILRMELLGLGFERTYDKWRKNKTVINTLESLLSMCKYAIWDSEFIREDEMLIELAESSNGTVSLKKCSGSSSDIFRLKIFLDFYNRGKLIFIFEYYDETLEFKYASEALSMLKSVTSSPRKQKTWIRCWSDSTFKSILEQEFGPAYKLEYFSPLEQDTYFNTFWKSKIQFKNLNSKQIQNVHDFAQFLFGLQPETPLYYSVKPYMKYYVKFLNHLQMEAIATGIDFPNDEYNHFMMMMMMMKMDINENKDSFKPDDKTPRELYLIANCFYNKIICVEKGDREMKWLIHKKTSFYWI